MCNLWLCFVQQVPSPSLELGVKTASVEFRFSFSIEIFFQGEAAGFECVLKQLACVAL